MLTVERPAQQGFSLVELMVGIAVGLIVIAVVLSVYIATIRGSTASLSAAKLNQELRGTMDIMINDVRRAGFWGTAAAGDLDSPFTRRAAGDFTDIYIPAGGGCVLYTYDATYQLPSNDLGSPDDSGDQGTDFFGFKLVNGVVQMRHGGDSNASADCSDGSWEGITDANTVVVDALTFTTGGSQCLNRNSGVSWALAAGSILPACVAAAYPGGYLPASGDILMELRQIDITLVGHLVADPAVRVSLNESVKVRNNRLNVVP